MTNRTRIRFVLTFLLYTFAAMGLADGFEATVKLSPTVMVSDTTTMTYYADYDDFYGTTTPTISVGE